MPRSQLALGDCNIASGQGKCPKERSFHRYELELCNTQDSVGDEVYIAKQDLVLTIDGNGFLKSGGFEALRDFVRDPQLLRPFSSVVASMNEANKKRSVRDAATMAAEVETIAVSVQARGCA